MRIDLGDLRRLAPIDGSSLERAVATMHRILAPGGVLLMTAVFADTRVKAHGNVLASIAFLHGLACEDLTCAELDHVDARYPTLITARAVKEGPGTGPPR